MIYGNWVTEGIEKVEGGSGGSQKLSGAVPGTMKPVIFVWSRLFGGSLNVTSDHFICFRNSWSEGGFTLLYKRLMQHCFFYLSPWKRRPTQAEMWRREARGEIVYCLVWVEGNMYITT